MGDVAGKSVLEIGFHDGEMARAFADRGAVVTAVEINPESYKSVRPHPNVNFILYDGNLDAIPGAFDFVFTKSVLVASGLEILPAIRCKLKPTGRVVFIENGRGGTFSRLLRRLRHPAKSFAHLDYFSGGHIARIEELFKVDVEYNSFPPVYLIRGHVISRRTTAR